MEVVVEAPPKEASFLERLKKEHGELLDRARKLDAFIDTTPFYHLSALDQSDLRVQMVYMQGYLTVLTLRMNRQMMMH